MSLQARENAMGGESVYLFTKEELSKVPASHRPLVGPEERAALRDVRGYFGRLAAAARLPALRWWLAMLSRCDDPVLELHTAGLEGVEGEALFRFYLYNGSSPAVGLRSGACPEELPPPLDDVYRLIDGTNHFGFGMAGGLGRAGESVSVAETGVWLSETNAIDPATCQPFYSTRGGDMLCYRLPDQAVWYTGETGMLREAGSLHALVERYFRGLLRGSALEPE